MGNMSYCRFQNTHNDLKDCFRAIEEGDIESARERAVAKQMLQDIVTFVDDWMLADERFESGQNINKIIDDCKPEEDDDDE